MIPVLQEEGGQGRGGVVKGAVEVRKRRDVLGGPCGWLGATCLCGEGFEEFNTADGHQDGGKHLVMHRYDLTVQ